MTARDIAARALATAIQSATAVLIGAGIGLVDWDVWEGAVVAALAGVVTVAHRSATRWLETHPEDGHSTIEDALTFAFIACLVVLVVLLVAA